MSNVISVSLDNKSAAWLAKQSNTSHAIRDLIHEKIKISDDEKVIKMLIKTLENEKIRLETELNSHYNQLTTILKNKEELRKNQKDDLKNILSVRKEKKIEIFRKIVASPHFNEIKKMKKYDEGIALKIIEKFRKSGNRELCAFDIKKFIDAVNGDDDDVKGLICT